MGQKKISRRDFLKGVSAAGAMAYVTGIGPVKRSFANIDQSRLFCVKGCPVHDGQLRHIGLDVLLDVMATRGLKLYRTDKPHAWGGAAGIIEAHDVVVIKVNCQWKCRGTINTDVLRGLIYRILQHPDGFQGEVVIFENGQGRGGFDGLTQGGSVYDDEPQIAHGIWINAEEENLLTVDYLVDTVFRNDPVSSFLMDGYRSNFIDGNDHSSNGYRRISEVSYPCFTSWGGHRIELREGIWNGSAYAGNLKLINVAVFKRHKGTGITGALKNTYGILSMRDGYSGIRHYSQSGIQCGKMMSLVRAPDLNIIDCIWVSHECLRGYPPDCTYRTDKLLAGIDPVALDYYVSKHIMYPLGGNKAGEHHPDSYGGLMDHLGGALETINSNGGIGGNPVNLGDENIDVTMADADRYNKANPWIPLLLNE